MTLASGNYTICVTARGTTTGPGFVTDCNTVQVVDVTVNCVATTPCTATATDEGVATATFRVPGSTRRSASVTSTPRRERVPG